MTTKQDAVPVPPVPTGIEVKNEHDHIDVASISDQKEAQHVQDPNAGYDGFTQKTDPKEIKLVKKLDKYIMISLWSMYWLNYLDRNAIALAPYYPGALLIISNFYTRTEIATRISVLYTGNILATAFAGLIAAGIFELDGKLGYAGWQWLFIIQGAATGVVALCAYPFLPDSPLNTRWLSEEERTFAHERLLRDKVDQYEKGSTMDGLKQAVSDPRVWIFCLMQNMHLSANGFKNFFPSVIKTLGFSQVIGLVLTCPPYLIAGVFSIAASLSSGKFNERTWHITVCKSIAIVGFVIAPATLNTAGRYVAMCIFTIGTYGVNSIILGWAATVCSQTLEKKAVTIAMMTSLSNASFIYTPYLFKKSDEPRYTTAMAAMAGFSLGGILVAWTMRLILRRQNKNIANSGSATKYPY